ncbi:hypothetical protein H5410_005209 [Solanum commersonii]|uniref:MADS-box domain-containing protein n=1 Tax=Solanum commersonii TaxID=4109 RepID=A0A9J6A7H6_SOLCO|nr:hypothetical protein H5410_005209 [Solanum commersonii]
MKNNVSDEGSTSNVPQSTPSTTMTFTMPSSIVDPPLYARVPSPMTPFIGDPPNGYISSNEVTLKTTLVTFHKVLHGLISYKKRHIGFMKKAQELITLCDIEIAAIIYSPYSDEPKVFPNHRAAINTFRKLKELVTMER